MTTFIALLIIGAWFLPTWIALCRRNAPSPGSVIAVNLIPLVGFLIALPLALRDERRIER